MTIMIISLCVVVGFKQTISSKVAGFGAHIRVVNFDNNQTYDIRSIAPSDTLLDHLKSMPHVANVSTYITKPGILKTDTEVQGIVLKAMDGDTRFWQDNLIAGTMPTDETDVILSESLCRLLHLGLNDRFLCYFVEDEVRVRRLRITGIYSTGFSEGDNLFAIATMPLLRRLNGWSETEVSGIEIRVDNLKHLENVADRVFFATANRLDSDGNAMYIETLQQMNPQIFSWLDLLDMNVIIILLLMLAVSGFSIVSALIIMILNSVSTIGILKALGANNRWVRKLFIYQSLMLVGRGMLYGNLVGLGLCALQYFTHVLPLDSATYYVDYIPVAFPWVAWLLLNIVTLVVSLLVMLAPSAIAGRISPAQVMRFE